MAVVDQRPPGSSAASGPLAGTVVLDLGQAAVAPIAATYLGMLGATVLKVESPRGDMVRVGEPNMRGTSTTFIGNNWGKLGTVVDLKSPEGRARLAELIARADLLIENFRNPQVLAKLGFEYATGIAPLNDRLVYVESSAFGDGGPLGDMVSNEWITEALGGMVSCTGAPDEPEFMRGTSLLDWTGAMVNTVVCLAGLLERERTGRGMAIRTSQLGSTLFAGLTRVAEMLVTGIAPAPAGSAAHAFAPDAAFATADGYLGLTVVGDAQWDALCAALGLGELHDRVGAGNAARVRRREEIAAELRRVLADDTTDAWLTRLAGLGVALAAFPHERPLSDELAGDPQVIAEAMLGALPTPWGLVRTAMPHWHFDRTPATISRPSPQFGADDDLPDADGDRDRRPGWGEALVEGDPAGLSPLTGRRVVVIGTGVSAPLAGRVLLELGGSVVKLEPACGDWLADAAAGGQTDDGVYREINAGVSIVRTDFADARERAQAWRRMRGADAVVIAGTPGQIERDGLGPAAFAAECPLAIVCRITGWGATGPACERPVSELAVQAAVGMYRHLGTPDGPPRRVGYDLVAVNTALAAVQAVLAGLLERDRSGTGQWVEVSMLATAVAISQWGITAESGADRPRGLQLEGYTMAPDRGVRCGDGRGCRLDFRKDHTNWYRLFDRLGIGDLARDPRFDSEAAIALHRNELADLITARLHDWTFAELDRFVRGCGGTVVPVLALDELLAHPQMAVLDALDREATDGPRVRFPYLASYRRYAAG